VAAVDTTPTRTNLAMPTRLSATSPPPSCLRRSRQPRPRWGVRRFERGQINGTESVLPACEPHQGFGQRRIQPTSVANAAQLARECELPEHGWGWLRLRGSTQHVGQDWGDGDDAREDRELKHRAKTATRNVPAAPELVRILRHHIAEYGSAPDGRLFTAQWHRQGAVSIGTYTRVWRQARKLAFTAAQQRSPHAKVPYHLRHAAVSLWLNAGVPATQVAEWAGHSVHVLLKVYAKCIDGQDDVARQRIAAALAVVS
jgi:integrase